MTCGFCLSREHSIRDCDDAKRVLARLPIAEPEPSTADDAMEGVVLRMHQFRAALRGALADLHAAGLEPSQATKALIPAHDLEP